MGVLSCKLHDSQGSTNLTANAREACDKPHYLKFLLLDYKYSNDNNNN